jgi:hypothetical protein
MSKPFHVGLGFFGDLLQEFGVGGVLAREPVKHTEMSRGRRMADLSASEHKVLPDEDAQLLLGI